MNRGFNAVTVEEAGVNSLLELLGVSLSITFEDTNDLQQQDVSFAADWGFCCYYRLTTGEISIEDLQHQCGVRVNPQTQQLTVWGKNLDHRDRHLWHGLIRYGVAAYLSDRGYTPIHAAAVIAPNGYSWIIAGQTHAGKSTLVLGLLAAGWQFLSDDSLVLGEEEGKIVAYAWLGTSLIDPILLQTYPHLTDRLGPLVGNRRLIDLKSYYPSQWIAKTQPQGLLFPTFSPNTPIADLEILSSGTALGNLMTHSAQWLMESPQKHLLHLQQLTYQCQYFNLLLGNNLRSQPQLVADILSEISA